MDKVRKYGHAVRKLYQEEGVTSTKAAAMRAKLRSTVEELEEGREEALEAMWQLAYYPVAKSREMDDYLRLALCTLIGELLLFPPSPSIYIYVGDLQRYQQTPSSLSLARQYYTRALMNDPEQGRPLNQLSLTMDPLPAIRVLLEAMLSKSYFNATRTNLEGRLQKMTSSSVFAVLLQAAISSKMSSIEAVEKLTFAATEWRESFKEELEELKSGNEEAHKEDRLMQLHCISLVVEIAQPSLSSVLISLVNDILLYLLDKGKKTEDEDEEEVVLKGVGRRRRASDDEEEDHDSDQEVMVGRHRNGRVRRVDGSDDEETHSRSSSRTRRPIETKDDKETTMKLIALSIGLEWLRRVDKGKATNDDRFSPIKGVTERIKLDRLVHSITSHLNARTHIAAQTIDLQSSPNRLNRLLISWMTSSSLSPSTLNQSIIDSFIVCNTVRLVAEDDSSVSLSIPSSTPSPPSSSSSISIFIPRGDSSLLRKMATLHMNVNTATDERPNSIVLLAGVLERRLGKIRALADRSHLVWFMPASELAELDTRKGVSKAARDALRFIELEQHSRVRVLPSGGVAEAIARGTIECPPVAVLSLDTAKNKESLPKTTQCLHIDSFAHSYRG